MTVRDTDQTPTATAGASRMPSTAFQARLWRKRHEPGAFRHNVAFRYRILGPLAPSVLEQAIAHVVARHEALRTGLIEVDGQVWQLVHNKAPLDFSTVDLSIIPAPARNERAHSIGESEARRAFDLRGPSLLRASLVRINREEWILHLTYHAAIIDGWSAGLVISEICSIYEALASRSSPVLPEVELQFADFALWQNDAIRCGGMDASMAFWRKELEHLRRTEVAPDRQRPDAPTCQSVIRSQLLTHAESAQVDAFCRRQAITLFSVASAALAVLLSRLTSSSKVGFSTQVAGRQDSLAAGIVGPLLNVLPLRFDVDYSTTPLQYVKTAQSHIRDALVHQEMPLESVLAAARPAGNGQPCAINLVVQQAYIDESSATDKHFGDISLLSMPSLPSGPIWDLNFFLVHREEGWRMSCEGDCDLFDETTLDHFLTQWRGLILMFTGDEQSASLGAEPILGRISLRPDTTPLPLDIAPAKQKLPAKNTDTRVLYLQEKGFRAPVIAVNNIWVFHHLAMEIGEEHPFLDVQIFDANGDRDLPRRAFEDYAADVVRMIQRVRPSGPYVLTGHCIYGSLALEAARQLQRAGEEIQLVALCDSWAPGYRETMPFYDKFLRSLQLRYVADAARIRRYRAGELSFVDAFYIRRLLAKVGLMECEPMPPQRISAWFDDYLRVSHEAYRPKPYDGDVILFRSSEVLHGRLFDREMGWRRHLVRPLDVFDVPGTHLDMFRAEPARIIGATIRERLRR